MSRYAILIKEANLDLIEKLNCGVRPLVQERTTYFITETDDSKETPNVIVFVENLYNSEDVVYPDMTILL